MKSLKVIICFFMVSTLLSGCVLGTRNIDLAPPQGYTNEFSSEGNVYIDLIDDKRLFERSPRKPSTPSVDGDLDTTPKAKLSSLIGRQRNSYGMAMGDVALPEGGTVQDEVREILTKAIESRGYKVVNDKNAPIRVSVEIEKFWAWFTPGFIAISFEANLQCKVIVVTKLDRHIFNVKGYGINKGQIASDANWKLVYDRAFLNFLTEFDKSLDEKGL